MGDMTPSSRRNTGRAKTSTPAGENISGAARAAAGTAPAGQGLDVSDIAVNVDPSRVSVTTAEHNRLLTLVQESQNRTHQLAVIVEQSAKATDGIQVTQEELTNQVSSLIEMMTDIKEDADAMNARRPVKNKAGSETGSEYSFISTPSTFNETVPYGTHAAIRKGLLSLLRAYPLLGSISEWHQTEVTFWMEQGVDHKVSKTDRAAIREYVDLVKDLAGVYTHMSNAVAMAFSRYLVARARVLYGDEKAEQLKSTIANINHVDCEEDIGTLVRDFEVRAKVTTKKKTASDDDTLTWKDKKMKNLQRDNTRLKNKMKKRGEGFGRGGGRQASKSDDQDDSSPGNKKG